MEKLISNVGNEANTNKKLITDVKINFIALLVSVWQTVLCYQNRPYVACRYNRF